MRSSSYRICCWRISGCFTGNPRLAATCVFVRELTHTQGLRGRTAIRDRMEIFLCPLGFHAQVRKHTNTPVQHTHQVFEKCRELLGEDRKLEEGRAQIGIISVHTVLSKFLQGLSVLFFVLHVGWEKTNTGRPKKESDHSGCCKTKINSSELIMNENLQKEQHSAF